MERLDRVETELRRDDLSAEDLRQLAAEARRVYRLPLTETSKDASARLYRAANLRQHALCMLEDQFGGA
jgi:hypothetical protein